MNAQRKARKAVSSTTEFEKKALATKGRSMTAEEMQRIIEGMLAVQRELQSSQLKLLETTTANAEAIRELRETTTANAEAIRELRLETRDLKESTQQLNEISQRHERRMEQLIGYSITGESDRLDVLGRLQSLERRMRKLEQGDEQS